MVARAVTFAALLLVAIFALPALAHPYLAAPAVLIGDARALPWNGETDFGLVGDYDIDRRLVPDTLTLLTPATPPLVRYEILRRAALYLSPRFAENEVALPLRQTLARRLQERVDDAAVSSAQRALSTFDAGCFEALCGQDRTLASERDGYAEARRVAGLERKELAAEAAYVLARLSSSAPDQGRHASEAFAGAQENTLLARNILRDFDYEFPTLAALREHLREEETTPEPMPGFPQPPPVPGANPDVRHEVVLLVPSTLAVREADGGALATGWATAKPEAVRLTVGQGMVVGTRIDESVWAGTERLGAHDTLMLLGGEPMGAAGSSSFLNDLPASGPLVLRAKVQVFETDIPPQHMWGPTGGHYRVLWERTYERPLR